MSASRRFGAGLVLALLAVAVFATPASAHDQLVASTPGDGEALADAPHEIVMTFSSELLVLDSSTAGAVVMVVDEAGHDWVSGDVDVEGDTVTAPLEPEMPVAGYQVRWQVVSADGHPISGVIAFTIGDAAPLSTTGGTAERERDGSADQITDETSAPIRVLLVGAGGAAIAAGGYALYRFIRRPRAAAASPDASESAAENT